ncbi:MAG: TrkH family potassium uptake protein [Clostridia bacterium]|nr:TrkH family potassium uptake protein [Clostridia bacterium]
MNRRMVLYVVGKVVMVEAGLMLLPLITALLYKEAVAVSIGISVVVAIISGFLLTKISRPGLKTIYAKEGFVITALSWLALSAVGALPFFISGEIPSYIDAFFETVSGLTTTGASILTDVEKMSKGLLMWRSFTHWVGGMGVLVFMLAIIPSISDRSIHLLRAEVPGPVVGKLVPKIRQTSRILYIIYIAITLIETVFLLFGGMNLFEALVHAFGTAGTGGFGIKATGIGEYSPYIQWVLTVFMLLFGVNFNLYYLILLKKIKAAFKSSELWTYFAIVGVSAVIIAVNISGIYDSVSETVRHAAFQVASLTTTTGFATVDFNQWPNLSKSILFILMFVGGCAGSTAGGFKISRIMMVYKIIKRELQRVLHPRSVNVCRLEGKILNDQTLSSVNSYLAIYVMFYFVFLFIIGFNGFDFDVTVSAVTSCFNNIGPAFGFAGPMGSYAEFSDISKIVLSVAMLFGRLEIYPIILTLSPSTWAKK